MESTTSTETLSIRDMYFNSVTQTLNVNCSVVLVYCTHFSIRACVAGKLVNLAADLLGAAMIQQWPGVLKNGFATAQNKH